jgi:carboxymethylenebutenolidase
VDAVRVEFPSGADRIGGVFVASGAGGPHPGIVVVPDVRGIYDHFHEVARRIAARGYAVLVLDLYAREGPPELPSMDAVFRFMRALPDTRVLGDVQAAIDWLAARPETRGRRIGVTGFCMGGKYALLAACACRGLSAAVVWYGMLRVGEIDAANPEHPLDALGRLGCPLLGLFGKEDPIVPLAEVEALERRGASLPHEVEVVVYPGAGHAFANDSRPEAYRADAAADAWSRAFAFFARHLWT